MLDARWTFNGDAIRPTFTPSVKCWVNPTEIDGVRFPGYICHSMIEDGFVRFLDDCTHEFRNETVQLPEIGRDLI